jgi:hypothetical protein
MKGDAFLLEFNLLMDVGLDKKVYFEWNPIIGDQYLLWEKGNGKPKLASSKEASFPN